MTQDKVFTKILLYLPLVLYLLLLVIAELISISYDNNFSTPLYIVLFFLTINHYIFFQKAPYSLLLAGLAFCCLLRVLNISLIVRDIEPIYRHLVLGIPLIVSLFVALWVIDIPKRPVSMGLKNISVQLVIIITSVFLGFLGYELLDPPPLVSEFNLMNILFASGILIMFNAFVEEVLFRWVIHNGAIAFLGDKGILLSSAIYIVMGIGFESVEYALFLALVSLFFEWAVLRTRSLVGVVIGHGIISISMLVILPLLA